MSERVTQTIGWQGVTLEAPVDWSLTGIGGDSHSGNVRVDGPNPNAKTYPTAIEIRWSDNSKAPNPDQLEFRLNDLIKALEKSAKKRREKIETWKGPVAAGRVEDRPTEIAFRWKAASAGSGRIWYCKTCGRTIIAQVYGHAGIRFLDYAGQILDSIGCHGTEIGWRPWCLYGLSTAAPATYALSSQQVLNVYMQLCFKQDRTEEKLTCEQWSLANVQLKDAYLDEWFETKAGSSLAHLRYEKGEDQVHGHGALAVTGRYGGLLYWLSDGLRTLLRFRMPATYFDALLWECAETNKTYLIQSSSRRPKGGMIRDIADRTHCHDEQIGG